MVDGTTVDDVRTFAEVEPLLRGAAIELPAGADAFCCNGGTVPSGAVDA